MRSAPILLGAGLAAVLGWYAHSSETRPWPEQTYTFTIEARPFPCTVASIHDGDTFRCAELDSRGQQIRVRLSGVAAREVDGSCSPGHPCPTASAEAATAELSQLVSGQSLTCQDQGRTYGRIAAFCRRSDGTDLSCAMVASGTALRWDRYWGAHRCD